MKYAKVYIDALGIQLPDTVVATAQLEAPLAPLYAQLDLPAHYAERLTGVRERRFWPHDASIARCAAAAARQAMAHAQCRIGDIGAIVYTSVCRQHLEPATAALVAAELGAGPETAVYDLSNACLGALNGIVDLANRIELGQLRAGLVVACEHPRAVVEETIAALAAHGDRASLYTALATLTGGSGAAAILVTDGTLAGGDRHRLLGGLGRSDPTQHQLCTWTMQPVGDGLYRQELHTQSSQLMAHGLRLARTTWEAFLPHMGLRSEDFRRTISHQVSQTHREHLFAEIHRQATDDFPTFHYLGNMGSASLPVTARIADADGFLRRGDRVAWLGIGSGLNCLMLALDW